MKWQPFDYSLDFKRLDFRKRRKLYRVGKGEQGVLLVEPYNSEILPHWRFKTVAEARKSSSEIYRMFLAYLKTDDFPGADMARKFLQMVVPARGVTRTTGAVANTSRVKNCREVAIR